MSESNLLIEASTHLSQNDERLASVIKISGPCALRPHKNYYQELVESIIGQQLSLRAAASILSKFKDLYGGEFPNPADILDTSHADLRSAGLSNAKAVYIRSLAEHVSEGSISFDSLDEMSNRQIIDELTKVKGIGEWTVHMFLIFCVGRLDVLPTGDLGIKKGIKQLYQLDHLPDSSEIEKIAEEKSWSPYCSVASWYLWKSLDDSWDETKLGERA